MLVYAVQVCGCTGLSAACRQLCRYRAAVLPIGWVVRPGACAWYAALCPILMCWVVHAQPPPTRTAAAAAGPSPARPRPKFNAPTTSTRTSLSLRAQACLWTYESLARSAGQAQIAATLSAALAAVACLGAALGFLIYGAPRRCHRGSSIAARLAAAANLLLLVLCLSKRCHRAGWFPCSVGNPAHSKHAQAGACT